VHQQVQSVNNTKQVKIGTKAKLSQILHNLYHFLFVELQDLILSIGHQPPGSVMLGLEHLAHQYHKSQLSQNPNRAYKYQLRKHEM